MKMFNLKIGKLTEFLTRNPCCYLSHQLLNCTKNRLLKEIGDTMSQNV